MVQEERQASASVQLKDLVFSETWPTTIMGAASTIFNLLSIRDQPLLNPSTITTRSANIATIGIVTDSPAAPTTASPTMPASTLAASTPTSRTGATSGTTHPFPLPSVRVGRYPVSQLHPQAP